MAGLGARGRSPAAKAQDKPILLSVGYAACHWCHVMAHESFENPAIAAVMNQHFVNIKVDREERPDIDAIYMHALHMMGEQGGWPLTMFLTPEGEPFWGGTYFPPTSRYGRPGFPQVLEAIAEAYRKDKETIGKNVTALRQGLNQLAAPQAAAGDRSRHDRPHRDAAVAARSTASMAASATRRNFRKARCSSCSGAPARAASLRRATRCC